MNRFKLILGILFVTGCSITPQTHTEIVTYNFATYIPGNIDHATQASINNSKKILVAPIAAPSWLDSHDMHYRLAYHNPRRSYTYAHSRWSSSPAFLLAQQIKQKITDYTPHLVITDNSTVVADNKLFIELEEFSQVFDSEHDSHIMIRYRANLVNNAHQLIAQRVFNTLETSSTADARGAADAFSTANNRLLDDLIQWLQAELNKV